MIRREFRTTQALLTSLTVVDLGGQEIVIRAAENFRTLRRLGVTVRKTLDTVIATSCIEHGFTLLHNDRDFKPFAQHLGLRARCPQTASGCSDTPCRRDGSPGKAISKLCGRTIVCRRIHSKAFLRLVCRSGFHHFGSHFIAAPEPAVDPVQVLSGGAHQPTDPKLPLIPSVDLDMRESGVEDTVTVYAYRTSEFAVHIDLECAHRAVDGSTAALN